MTGSGAVGRAAQLRWLAGIFIVAIGFAVAILLSGNRDGRGHGTKPTKFERQQRAMEREFANAPDCPPPALSGSRGLPDPAPARIRSPAPRHLGPITESVNGWTARSAFLDRRLAAGAAGAAESTGAIAIDDFRPCTRGLQESTVLLFPGTGALEVVDAPEGEGVAGDVGHLTLRSVNNATVVLALDDLDARCQREGSGCRVIAHQDCDGAHLEDARGAVTRVWGISCEEALDFAQAAAANECNLSPFSCNYAGYRCRELGIEGAGNLPVTCQAEARRIDITWSVG